MRFLFLGLLRCFSSAGSLLYAYEFSAGFQGITPGGLPHSETSGSKTVCVSPKHIAAYRVLRRLT
jgi:hypothetical protein